MLISDALGVTEPKFNATGAFNSYIGIDSRLHIDPALLRGTRIPEFRQASKQFDVYFEGVFALSAAASVGGALERQAIEKLIFPEISEIGLGVSRESTMGRGVSRALAGQLYRTAKEVIDAGIRDSAIFELAVVFEKGFGADLISDMTAQIILDSIGNYNSRVCHSLGVTTREIDCKGKSVMGAYCPKVERSVLLVPRGLLSSMPEALCSEDIDEVASYNSSVRQKLNKRLGANWSNLVRNVSKGELRAMFFQDPKLLRSLLDKYKKRRPAPYNFDSDPLGEVIWKAHGETFAAKHKLPLSKPASSQEVEDVVYKMAQQFKRLIENNRLCRHLYDDEGHHRPEKYAQLLFFAVADSYCKSNDLDLSAEPNAGRGPVDFKISAGYQSRVLVEVKLSSNSKGLEGLLLQLPAYAKSENADRSIYLLIVVGKSRTMVDTIVEGHKKITKSGGAVPRLVIVEAYDANEEDSASKLRW